MKWIVVIFGLGNGMWPIQHQAINWTSDGLWLKLNGSLGIHFSEILLRTQKFSLQNVLENYVCKISIKAIAYTWYNLVLI